MNPNAILIQQQVPLRRPMSAYNFFFRLRLKQLKRQILQQQQQGQEQQEGSLETIPSGGPTRGSSLRISSLFVQIAWEWTNSPPGVRARFEAMARRSRARFNIARRQGLARVVSDDELRVNNDARAEVGFEYHGRAAGGAGGGAAAY